MTYTETHALILNHNKHKQEHISKSSGNSYNTFTYIIILITNLCFFRYLVYGTELILITNLYLLRSYTDDRLILIPISRRTHTYAYSRRTLIQVSQRTYIYRDLYLYLSQTYNYSNLPNDIYLNFCQTDTYPHTRTYISLKSLVGVHRTYTYTEVPLGTIRLILILRILHLFGGTRMYYRDITERILVLQNLFLYGSTRKYYKTYTGISYLILVLRSIS